MENSVKTIENDHKNWDLKRAVNYMLIAYALCVPVSKAGANLFESLMLLIWIYERKWKTDFVYYKQNLLTLGLILFISYSLLSVLWAVNISHALDYVWKYRHFLIIFVMYSYLEDKYVKYIVSSFLLGMFVSEAMSYGIFFELFSYKDVPPHNPVPFMDHTNYSAYLVFTSILILSTLFFCRGLKLRIIYLFFFLTVTGNLFLNGGRTGQLIFIVLILILFFTQFKNKLKAIFYSLLLIFVVFTTAYNISPIFKDRIGNLQSDINNMIYENNYKGSFAIRVSLWITGFDTALDNVILGSGIGNEMKEIIQNANEKGFDGEYLSKFADFHNVFITYFVQLGIIGLGLVLMIFYSVFSIKITNSIYKPLPTLFMVFFTLWSFTGMTFHNMNGMIIFTLFAGLFNAIQFLENKTNFIERN